MSSNYTFKPDSWCKTSKLIIECEIEDGQKLISLATTDRPQDILFALPPADLKKLGQLLVAISEIEGDNANL